MRAPAFTLLLAMIVSLTTTPAANAASDPKGTIILLHGMGRTRLSMQKLGNRLATEGYQVINLGYPSTQLSVGEAVRNVRQTLAEQSIPDGHTVHFVTHSLGGIVLRALLAEHSVPNLGRVVMLSPPNQGSELADRFIAGPLRHLYRFATGPSGQELGTTASSTPNQLGAVKFPLGVIIGNRSPNPIFSRAFPGPNDGKVSVERAKVDGMTDFLVVPRSHTYIMRSSQVGSETVHFLKHGRFSQTSA